jgi:hypothetical protein
MATEIGNGTALLLPGRGGRNNVAIPSLKLWRSSFTISFWVYPPNSVREECHPCTPFNHSAQHYYVNKERLIIHEMTPKTKIA